MYVAGLATSTTYYFALKTTDESGNVSLLSNVPNGTTLGYTVTQTVTYTYDDLNRVLTEDNTGKAGTEVTYVYDVCQNGKGRTCQATTTDGGTHNTYYATGVVATELKIVNGTAYTTGYDYDVQGNQILITYPDSSLAQYNYNDAGQLESVSQKESSAESYTDIITDFDYSPLGQVTYQRFNNGVVTTNTYDEDALYRLETTTTIKN
jgi:hypothetical protein